MRSRLTKGVSTTGNLKSGLGRERYWDVYISNLDPSTTITQIIDDLKGNSISIIDLKLFDPEWAKGRFKTGKLCMSFVHQDTVKSPSFWLVNVSIRDWNHKPREVGKQSLGLASQNGSK